MTRGQFLGVVYLDSRRPGRFRGSTADSGRAGGGCGRHTGQCAARGSANANGQAAGKPTIKIARDIQQALLPRGFKDYPHLMFLDANFPCLSVGGDYFDGFPMGDRPHSISDCDVREKDSRRRC